MAQVESSPHPLNSGKAEAITADEAGGGVAGVPPGRNLSVPPVKVSRQGTSLSSTSTLTRSPPDPSEISPKDAGQLRQTPPRSGAGPALSLSGTTSRHPGYRAAGTATKTLPATAPTTASSSMASSPIASGGGIDDDSPRSTAVDWAKDGRQQSGAPIVPSMESGAATTTATATEIGTRQRHDLHRQRSYSEDDQGHLIMMQQQQLMQQQRPSPATTPDRDAVEQHLQQNPDDQAAAGLTSHGHRRHRSHRKHKHKHKSHRSHRSADASDPFMAAQLPPMPPVYQQYYPQDYQQGIPGQHPQQHIGQPPPPGMAFQGAAPRTPGRTPKDGDYLTPPPKSTRRSRLQKSNSAPTGGNLFGTPTAAQGGYGAVDGVPSHTFPGPPMHAAPHYTGGGPVPPSQNFSPRKELLALSGISSSCRGRMQAPPSPGAGGTFGGAPPGGWISPQISPGGQPMHSVPRSIENRPRANSFGSDRGSAIARLSPLRESRPITDEDMMRHLIPSTPLLHGGGTSSEGRGVYTAPHDGTPGEADAFLPQHISSGSGRKGSHMRSASSMRKMHMRQQSVELFMGSIKGSEQPKAFRDVFFAILFYAQLAAMLYMGIRYGKDAVMPGALGGDGEKTEDIFVTYHNVIVVACMCGAFAVATSALALFVMMAIARRLVQFSLMFSIGMAFAWGTIGIGLSPKSFVPITGIIALALCIGYTFVVWDRIPFATSNLHSALSGIRVNLGVVGVTFCFQALTLAVSIYYTFAVIGLYDAIKFGDVQLSGAPRTLAFIGVGLAYYWTYQVIVHVVQVTVAGVIGSWWFKPDSESSPCSGPLRISFVRSTILSFGSVCFGSLLVGFVQALRQIAEPIRPNRDESVLMCLHECLVCFQECIVSCVDTLADSFTPWAFTYVGLYGYGFLDAGHKATELFQKRGWTKIVTDDLITNVLFIVSLVIGGVTGCFALLIEAVDDYKFHAIEQSTLTAFLLGLAVGIVLSGVLFAIISSSVNAVIVCFAGSPIEFQKNHAELSDEMRHAWREVWPGCMDIIDLKISMNV